MHAIEEIEVPVLIIGGGPAGMSAAIQLGQRGIRRLLVDDKDRLGGKLVLQTHRFFGSINAVYAGTRGIDIATKLEQPGAGARRRRDLAEQHRAGRVQRSEGGHPAGRPPSRRRATRSGGRDSNRRDATC